VTENQDETGIGHHGSVSIPPDPRFIQANERTYLAWLRTALAVGAASLGIAGLAPVTDPTWVRPAVSLVVVAFAVVVLVWALRRYRAADTALRTGVELPSLHYAALLAIGLAVVLVASVTALLLAT
jgi:putative membrane protein